MGHVCGDGSVLVGILAGTGTHLSKRMQSYRVFGFVVILAGVSLIWALGFAAQQPGTVAGNEAQSKIRVNSNLVVLPVTVKDRYGNLVGDMEMRDFRVFDDDVEQSIDIFTAEAFPLSLVILVDDDLKAHDAAALVASLRTVTAGISTGDEAMVCHFDLKFYSGEKFTRDEDELLAELNSAKEASAPSKAGPIPVLDGPGDLTKPGIRTAPIRMGSRPTKALDDSVYTAAQLLHERDRTRRKIILLISDGLNGAVFNTHNYEETLDMLLHENVTVFALAVGSDSFQKKFGRMRDYANNSGGDIYYAAKSEAMQEIYAQLTEQARHEYTIAYQPKGNNAKTDYHVVRVSTSRGGLFVNTRQGYYTETIASPSEK
jgi:Ca-activated chloride channel homolog